MPTISLILAPVDFSAGSESAAAYARWLAGRLGARIRVLHVFPRLDHLAAGVAPNMAAEALRSEQTLWREAEQNLADLGERLGRPADGPALETAIMRAGDLSVAEAIVQAAREAGADLIVMGTHGRSGIRRMILGSVAEQVLRAAACPVLTIK
jgi:nucleotide-binding universal stress UspA family protein